MRLVVTRADVGRIYISDIENRSQRNFSSQPEGQSLYVSYTTDEAIAELIEKYGGADATVAAFKAAVYTEVDGIRTEADVSVETLATGLDLDEEDDGDLEKILKVQDAIAPRIVETGQAILSFDRGVIGGFRNPNFEPVVGIDGSKLPKGPALLILTDDGDEPYVI